MTLLRFAAPDAAPAEDRPEDMLLQQALERAGRGAPTERLLAALIELDAKLAARWLHRQLAEGGSAPPTNCLSALIEAAEREPELWAELAPLYALTDFATLDARALARLLEGTASVLGVEVRRQLAEQALRRAPQDVQLLRAAVGVALEQRDARWFHSLLSRLGRADPTASTVRWCQRVRTELPFAAVGTMTIALLGSSTLDLLAAYVDLECRELRLQPHILVGGFNAWGRECVDPESAVRALSPDLVILAVHIDDLIPDLAGYVTEARLEAEGAEAIARLRGAVEALRSWSSALIVVHEFDSVHGDPLGVAGARTTGARHSWLDRLNLELRAELAVIPRVHTADTRGIAARRSSGSYDDPKMRHMAALRITPAVAAAFARTYAAHIAPLKGQTRKCVVLDLDNTLWGGVVGEDGADGIRLNTASAGAEFYDLQCYLRALVERGFLLALNSKNNHEDALAVIRSHPAMVLREDVFSALRINWQPKPENMVEIARELNIGLDSMIFIDDNPHERELMRQALPEVLTPELPADPALYRTVLEALPQLQVLEVTQEDRARTEMYRAQQERAAVRVQAQTLEQYLASLHVSVELSVNEAGALQRVHQLLQRTNQFNLTTRRHEIALLEAWLRDPACRIYTLRARDRFGDHGLVAVALVEQQGTRQRIDSLLMSCRVISYGLESALLAEIVRDARAGGAELIVGEYIETPKNAPARDFYSRHGFRKVDGAVPEQWLLTAADAPPRRPDWIALERSDAS